LDSPFGNAHVRDEFHGILLNSNRPSDQLSLRYNGGRVSGCARERRIRLG